MRVESESGGEDPAVWPTKVVSESRLEETGVWPTKVGPSVTPGGVIAATIFSEFPPRTVWQFEQRSASGALRVLQTGQSISEFRILDYRHEGYVFSE